MRIPPWTRRRLTAWAHRTMARREPDLRIGADGPGSTYMERWFLFRGALCSLYLHRVLRDDDDRALHDHPAASVSIILEGGYHEVLPRHPSRWPINRETALRWCEAGRVLVRPASLPHRLSLLRLDRGRGRRQPCITLFLFGPRVREWGFWCRHGWVWWQDFIRPGEPGSTGPGCDAPATLPGARRGERPLGAAAALWRRLLARQEA